MDLSKLPKLSDTKSQVPAVPSAESDAVPPNVVSYQPYSQRRPGVGVDVWISLVIGILLLMMGRTFGQFVVAKIHHQPFSTGYTWDDDTPKAGQPKEYFDLDGFTALSDMGIFLFGAMLVFEAVAKTIAVLTRPGSFSTLVLTIAILLTAATTLINIYACIKLFDFGTTPTISALAVAFGGWILFDEWATLQRIKKP